MNDVRLMRSPECTKEIEHDTECDPLVHRLTLHQLVAKAMTFYEFEDCVRNPKGLYLASGENVRNV